MEFKVINPKTGPDELFSRDKIVDFLYVNLVQYGDKPEAINKCLDYALDEKRGGFILLGHINTEITGAVVINHTGMSGYIPENILVYIAVRKDLLGKGYGKQLMQKAISLCEGNVALHVEKDNPARFLYEKLGFTNPYLEMRLTR